MRILFLLPFSPTAGVGNATTARRIQAGLERFGHQTQALGLAEDLRPDSDGKWEFPAELKAAATDCDLIIALHAVRTGPVAAGLKEALQKPFVLLFTGTDLNGKPPAWAVQSAARANACVALAPVASKRASEIYSLSEVETILQAAAPLPEPRGGARMPERLPKLDADDFLVFVPSGIRPVKDPQRAVRVLRKPANRHARLKLWIAGEMLDQKEMDALQAELDKFAWAEYVGPLTAEEMAPVMRRANLVASTSRSEGGPPNALLEAALFARPIAASNIPMHRFFPGPQFVFRDDGYLVRMIERCMEEPQKVAMEARQLCEETRTKFDRTSEAVAWDRLVRRVDANPWKAKA